DAERSRRVFDAALHDLPPAPARPGRARAASNRRVRGRHLRADAVPYGEHPAQLLDVWGPARPVRDAPVLVQVHGGGWTGGSRVVSAAPLLAHLVERGWVCVTVDYRLAPAHRLPVLVADVKQALAWVKREIGAYGGDPGFVAVSGGSAGGHLASLVALTAHDRSLQPGCPDADTSVAAAVPVYGVHDFSIDEHGLHTLLENTVLQTSPAADPETWQALSPLHRVDEAVAAGTAPPFLVVHGSTDTIVSAGQSRRFVRRMREAGAEVRHAELPRAQHGFDSFPTARTHHHVRAVHRFLAAVHDRYRSG
ncbi:MAG: alpha/beta hydrolase, partial [Pseudonocardiales bacterium]|nr:alpha/beta hydrolase [Pseudonocardiales bacterium]